MYDFLPKIHQLYLPFLADQAKRHASIPRPKFRTRFNLKVMYALWKPLML